MKCLANLLDHASRNSAGRLAVEQVYGYMCWNSVQLGILMTTTGFVFLRREDGGILHLSRVYGSHHDLEGFQYVMPHSMAPQSNFTISHMLYWFTAMTEQAPLVPETRMQQAVQVEVARRAAAFYPTSTAYAVPVPSNYIEPQQAPPAGPSAYTGYTLQSATDVFLEFKPWLRQNHRGGRAWNARLLPEKIQVIVKCWDSYKNSPDPQNTEVDIYLRLHELWGICVPRFIAVGRVAFCYAIILEDLEVTSMYSCTDNKATYLSKDNICTTVEDKIRKAYHELHRRKVLHGDVRASNILVSNNKSVYIIDFESSRTEAESALEDEMCDVEKLFGKVRNETKS